MTIKSLKLCAFEKHVLFNISLYQNTELNHARWLRWWLRTATSFMASKRKVSERNAWYVDCRSALLRLATRVLCTLAFWTLLTDKNRACHVHTLSHILYVVIRMSESILLPPTLTTTILSQLKIIKFHYFLCLVRRIYYLSRFGYI
jgi:hypothetical protein